MAISEFAVRNVLRTYSRQERLGQAQRPAPRAGSALRPADQVTLSVQAKKAQSLGQFAGELVDARYPGLPAEERDATLREAKDELLARHSKDLSDPTVTPEALEARLRSLYLS